MTNNNKVGFKKEESDHLSKSDSKPSSPDRNHQKSKILIIGKNKRHSGNFNKI